MADRPPPAVDRGPHRPLGPRAQQLVARARERDRSVAARLRVLQVQQGEARLQQRHKAAAVVGWSVAVLVAVAAGWWARGLVGAVGALAIVAVVASVRRALDRLAARRGALAWDWRARRYRLTGNPSAEVQSLDGYTGARDALGQRRRSTN